MLTTSLKLKLIVLVLLIAGCSTVNVIVGDDNDDKKNRERTTQIGEDNE